MPGPPSRSTERGSTAQGLIAAVRVGTREAIGGWMRQTVERWPAIRPIIRIGRDAAVVDPELGHLVDRWLEEAISDVEDALRQAGRFQPHQRHLRGVLAYVTRYLAHGGGLRDRLTAGTFVRVSARSPSRRP
jgi:hypothetical protein